MSDDPYRLSSILASLPMPPEGEPVRTASDMLRAFVAGCDSQGRYYASPRLWARLIWWSDVSFEQLVAWRDELVDRGDLEIRPDAIDCYSDSLIDVAYVTRPREHQRFSDRRKISPSVREEVYRRDRYKCVTCGSRERLTLDHIHPWSLGGLDELDNLQTMCQPCNSRKGARVDA